jgi:hypothetical protein
MLNYTTTTIVNDGSTVSVKEIGSTGNKKLVVAFAPELWIDDKHKPTVLAKTPYQAAQKAKVTISSLPTDSGVYRIALYIRLRNNQNPYFSNDWTFKGKPLFIEFNGGSTAKQIASLVKKYSLVQYGYDLVKVKANGSSLEIEAVDQWEIFMDQDANTGVKVQELATVDMAGKVVASGTIPASPTHEAFVDNTSVTVTVDNGNEAFGDFAHLVKDLRLPTGANLRWQGIAQGDVFGDEPNDDRPLPTGKYTQYTIQYDSERGILQQTALGGLATSRTVHVFYVESEAVSAFDAALEEAGLTIPESSSSSSTTTDSSSSSSSNSSDSDPSKPGEDGMI